MPGFTHSIGVSYKTAEGNIASTTSSQTGDQEFNYDAAVSAGAVNAAVLAPITKADLLSVCIYSDQAITIKVNSTSSPQEVITIAAKQQVQWNVASPFACPFSGDVTEFFISNAGAVPANVSIRTLSQI